MHLIDARSTPAWALRLADPRHEAHLPGSANATVRMRALDYLGPDPGPGPSPGHSARRSTGRCCTPAATTSAIHGIGAIPAKSALPTLLAAVILTLAD